MDTVCTVSSIHRRLDAWGSGEIKVKRMGGKTFLIVIEDGELFQMLKDLKLAYLKDIFSDVRLWSESFNTSKRATWVEISGVPIHCWNGITFKRLIGIGELLKHSGKTSIAVSTVKK
ncbi:hypothetical protein V6N13_099664 [Hibiscus sabdariffa]